MTFLNPFILISATAILIPVFLHFFFRRKKKLIYFSSIRFLKELNKKQLIKSSWLEWILLALRILTILFVVLAFAYPSGKTNLFFSNHDEVNTFVFINHNEFLNISEKEVTLKEKLLNNCRDFLKNENLKFVYWVSPYDLSISKISSQDLLNRITELNYFQDISDNISQIQTKISDFANTNNFIDYRTILLTVEKMEELKNIEVISPNIDEAYLKNIGIQSAYIKESIRSTETELTLIINLDRFQFNEESEILITINNKTFFNEIIESKSNQLEIKLGKFSENTYKLTIQLLNQDNYKKDNFYHLNFKIDQSRTVLVLAKNETSILNRFFNEFPDSSLTIITDYSFNSLRYQFNNYNTVFLESPLLNKSGADQILRYLNQGTLILFADSSFDQLAWNQSELSKEIKFKDIVRSSSRIREKFISSFFLPKRQKKSKAIEAILVSKKWTTQKRNWNILIGNKSNELLIEKNRFFIFLSGLNENENNLIYHPIMANILYQLIFGSVDYIQFDEIKNQLIIKNTDSQLELDLTKSPSGKKIKLTAVNNSLGKSYFNLPKNIEIGHYDFMVNQNKLVFSLNPKQLKFSNINLDGSEVNLSKNLSASSNFYYWRFFIFLALITYILEFLIGQIAIKKYEK